jgi:hypothetical protein
VIESGGVPGDFHKCLLENILRQMRITGKTRQKRVQTFLIQLHQPGERIVIAGEKAAKQFFAFAVITVVLAGCGHSLLSVDGPSMFSGQNL